MKYPVSFIGITNGFSKSHFGLDCGWHKTHNCPVYAIADGIVTYVQYQKTGGYVVHIRHENGFVSEYGHLQKGSIKVKVKDEVKLGQQIANMGDTGKASGEHLHLGLYKGKSINYNVDKWVNPINYLEVYEGQEVAKSTLKQYGNQIKYHQETWDKGKYELLYEKYIRTSPRIPVINKSNCVKVGDIMPSKRDLLTSQNVNDWAIYRVSTVLDITEIVTESNGRIWGKTINTYVCLCNKDGKAQANKIN